MIFQDPLSSMHPFYTVGDQIIEAYRVHNKVNKAVARKHAIDMLGRVGIPQPERRVDDYPHQFSGGMRQRAMIAMALSCDPELLIADEPTTALDVTVQAQILDLMRDLQAEFNSAVIIITHDLGVVAELADDILVMYGGKGVEYGTADELFERPEHPYTWGLLGSMPRLDRDPHRPAHPDHGHPAVLINVPSGCAFHPRCAYADRTGGAEPRPWCPTSIDDRPAGIPLACHLTAEQRRERLGERHQARTCEDAMSRPRGSPRTEQSVGTTRRRCCRCASLEKHFPITKGLLRRKVGAVQAVDGRRLRRSTRARRSAWSASPAAARPPPAGCSPGCSSRPAGTIVFEGRDITPPVRRARCARCAATCR